jgi:hypothetical protein
MGEREQSRQAGGSGGSRWERAVPQEGTVGL